MLPLVLLVTQLTQSAPLKRLKKQCTDPHLQFLTSKWYIYINLPQINVYSCGVTKTKKFLDCYSKSHLRTENTFYYDITRNCLDLAHEGHQPNSVNTKYNCDSGYIMDITEERAMSTFRARVDLKTDQVFLPSNSWCRYSSGFCYDASDKNKAYVWDTKLEDRLTCSNLIRLQIPQTKIVKFTLLKEYLVFEGEENFAFAVELVKQVDVCGGKAWTNDAGIVVTNSTSFERRGAHDERAATDFFALPSKQTMYESLVEQCDNARVGLDLYFCAIVFLLVYVGLHFVYSTYHLVTNYRTFRRVKGEACTWLFQSWINKLIVNNSIVAETKLRSDIQMNKLKQDSYYEFRRPT